VTLVEGERAIPYASVMPDRPVTLRVVGPTTLDLMVRLDFEAHMRGSQTYRLGFYEHGKQLRGATFKTAKATLASYSDLPDRVPPKSDRRRLQVGSGTPEITVKLLSPNHATAEIHARIPEPQVGDHECPPIPEFGGWRPPRLPHSPRSPVCPPRMRPDRVF